MWSVVRMTSMSRIPDDRLSDNLEARLVYLLDQHIREMLAVGRVPYSQREALDQLAFRWIFDSLKEPDDPTRRV